jgi:hypothetical protein
MLRPGPSYATSGAFCNEQSIDNDGKTHYRRALWSKLLEHAEDPKAWLNQPHGIWASVNPWTRISMVAMRSRQYRTTRKSPLCARPTKVRLMQRRIFSCASSIIRPRPKFCAKAAGLPLFLW